LSSGALIVCSILHLSDDIVSLAEEGKPFTQHRLLLIIQIIPIRPAILRLQRRAGKGPGRILSSENYTEESVTLSTDQASNYFAELGEAENRHTAILAIGTISRILAHIKHNSLDCDKSWAAGVRACKKHISKLILTLTNPTEESHTVAFGQFLHGDRVILRRIQLNRDFGFKALGFWLVFHHFDCMLGRLRMFEGYCCNQSKKC